MLSHHFIILYCIASHTSGAVDAFQYTHTTIFHHRQPFDSVRVDKSTEIALTETPKIGNSSDFFCSSVKTRVCVGIHFHTKQKDIYFVSFEAFENNSRLVWFEMAEISSNQKGFGFEYIELRIYAQSMYGLVTSMLWKINVLKDPSSACDFSFILIYDEYFSATCKFSEHFLGNFIKFCVIKN